MPGWSQARADSSANSVGEPFGGSNVVKQPRRKSSAKGLIKYRSREVIWISPSNSDPNHLNVALINVGLLDQVISRLGWIRLWRLSIARRRTLRSGRPGRERLAQASFHLRRVEIADYSEDDVVRVNVFAVPLDQILTRDCGRRSILSHPRIRTVRPIHQLSRFPSGDLRGIIIAPRNAVVNSLLRDANLFRAKFRVLQHILEHAKHVVKIFFQTCPADARRFDTSAGLDLGGALLEIVVELISGLGFGAAGAPYFTIDVDQAGLAGGNRALAAADASGAVNGRQLVVFLKKNHHAIR